MLTTETAARRAAEIHRALMRSGEALQVRWHRGQLLTFRFPAPRGYGVRGELVATYNTRACLEWIETDLIEFAVSLGCLVSDTCEPVCA